MNTITSNEFWERKNANLPTLLIDVRNQQELAVFNAISPNRSPLSSNSFTISRISLVELPKYLSKIKEWYQTHATAKIIVACTRKPKYSPRVSAIIEEFDKEGVKTYALQDGLHSLHFQHGFITITETIL